MNQFRKMRYEDICQSQDGTVINRLIDGEILLITGVSPVLRLRAHVRRLVEAYGRVSDLTRVDRFFKEPDLDDTECIADVCRAFHHIRDCRLLGEMCAPLVRRIGGRSELLVDTGHFRCLFPDGLNALSEREDIADMMVPGRPGEPEPFLNDHAKGGNPHRDIPHPHYTFQYNMWFPLHDIPSGAALLLFPETYHKPADLYEDVDQSIPPGDWGYGHALQPAMSYGDVLLFHSQHFHASPTEEPNLTRVTVELRVATGSQDDNSSTYRHLFWNVKNFSAIDEDTLTVGQIQERELSYLNATMTSEPYLESIGSPQHCFNALFNTPEAARMAGNLRAGYRFIQSLNKLSKIAWEEVADYFLKAVYADDRSIALVRIFWLTGQSRLADMFVALMLARSESYFFLMELGCLLGKFDKHIPAITAYQAARRCAVESKIEMDPYHTDLPTSLGSDIILPETGVMLCDSVLNQASLVDHEEPNFNPFDYRIYNPGAEVTRFADESGTFRLTLSFATLLVLWRLDGSTGREIVWCCELEEWMSADKVPASIETQDDMALELAKKYYLELPKLIGSLIQKNQQLMTENESLKKALLNDSANE